MLKYLLDTNTCIYVMKNRPEQVKQRFIEHQHRVCISSVVLMELMCGAEKSNHVAQNLNTVEEFVANLSILDFDTKASAIRLKFVLNSNAKDKKSVVMTI